MQPPNPTAEPHRPGVNASVFTISLAALALEVLQMRLFAFTLWHHLAFLVVSIAILGFGAAGALLASSRWLQQANLGRSIWAAGLLFAGSAFVGPLVMAGHPIDVFDQPTWADIGRTGLYYVLFALPYVCAGWTVALALTQHAESVNRVYFANLLGSGIGCFVLFSILEPLGAEASLVVLAGLGAVSSMLAPIGFGLRLLAFLVIGCCALVLPGINEIVRPEIEPLLKNLPRLDGKDPAQHPHRLQRADEILRLQPARSKFLATYLAGGQKTLATRWSPLGRIDIVSDPTVGAGGEPGACLFQDGDAPGQMPHRDWPAPVGLIHGVGYVIKPAPEVLIIGIGGGLDVKTALDRGAKTVTGVEINPTTLGLYENEFKALTGDPEGRENVTLEVAEGRHFVRSSQARYDLIQMSGVDTYTALASGANVLSESYLYTKEAFRDYLGALRDDGLLVMVRFAWPKPRETLRAMILALVALRESGVADPGAHVVVLRNQRGEEQATRLGALLVKRSPFTPDEVGKLGVWADANGYSRDYLPGESLPGESAANPEAAKNVWHQAVHAMDPKQPGKLDEFLQGYEFKIDPVTDDAPFFFDQHRWKSVFRWLGEDEPEAPRHGHPVWAALLDRFQRRPVGLLLLGLTLVQLLFLSALLIFLPLVRLRRALDGGSALVPLGYFACLGLAYILLMISAMQRFALVLGHPTYSVTVSMATFLIGSGFGSWFLGALGQRSPRLTLIGVALVLALSAWALQEWLPDVAQWLLGQPFEVRVAATIGLLLPMAFAMGACFPAGISVLAHGRRSMIPWAYGVNGAASVLGSVLAVLLAMQFGFTDVQWVATGLYGLAALLMLGMARRGAIAA